MTCAVLILCMAGLALADSPARQDPAEWVPRLADADPVVRREAAEALKSAGASARPALVEAMYSKIPAIRAAAGQLLLQLPFDIPGDPPAVRQALAGYGQKVPSARRAAIDLLASQRTEAAARALDRLVREEPQEAMRWHAAGALRRVAKREAMDRLRAAPPDHPSSVLLTLAGWAWLGKDRSRALDYFGRAVEREARHPTADGGQLDIVFGILRGEATRQGRHDAVAQLLRQQVSRQIDEARDPEEEGDPLRISPELFALFVLHLKVGPLEGWEADLERFGAHLDSPPMLYALGKWYEWRGWPAAAEALYRTAWSLTPPTAANRFATGKLLLGQGWAPLAERELLAAVAGAGERVEIEAESYLALHRIAVARQDDAAAAGHLEKLLNRMADRDVMVSRTEYYTGETAVLDPAVLWAEVHWRYLRAAQAKEDAPAVKKHLEALLTYRSTDVDLVLEVVPLLKELGRSEDAQRVLMGAYEPLKRRLEADPDNAQVMNNLAWLLARSGERLEEAARLSGAAIAAEPDNASYLDTAAEAQFRLGNKAEAIRLEKRALELRPGDAFMEGQLRRFME